MTKDSYILVDTNVWIHNLEELKQYDNLVISGMTLRELDKLKNSPNSELAYRSREASRYIKESQHKFKFDPIDYNAEEILGKEYDNSYTDNRLVASCVKNRYSIISNDLNVQFKAKAFGVNVIELDGKFEDDTFSYTGVREIFISRCNQEDNELLARIYSEDNPLNMIQHEYLVIWDKDKPHTDEYGRISYECIDTLRFDGKKLVNLKYKPTEDRFMGKTKPINVKQRLAFDLLQNKDIVGAMILGGAGSGKDYIIAAHLMQKLNNGEIDKIVFVRNIEPLKDSGQLGFLKGDLLDKMQPWILPLADQIGGLDALNMLVASNKIEVQHFESIRGRSFNRCGVWVTEMQSMSSYHAKVLISRIGEGSYLFMNGDINQTDNDSRKYDSAINTFKKLKGNKMFGIVTLDKTERSNFASLAEFL